jgi:hypothetical protein
MGQQLSSPLKVPSSPPMIVPPVPPTRKPPSKPMHTPIIIRPRPTAREHTTRRLRRSCRLWRIALAWLHAGLVTAEHFVLISFAAPDAEVAVERGIGPAAAVTEPGFVFDHFGFVMLSGVWIWYSSCCLVVVRLLLVWKLWKMLL